MKSNHVEGINTMSDKPKQGCNRLQEEVMAAETCLTNLGHHPESAVETKVDALGHRHAAWFSSAALAPRS